MNQGYISLFLVLIISLSVSLSVYHFFQQNEYYLYLKKDEFIQETKRMVFKVCLNLVQEGVYGGQSEEYFTHITVSKSVFGSQYACKVVESKIIFEDVYGTYQFTLDTPFGMRQVRYTVLPRLIKRTIHSS